MQLKLVKMEEEKVIVFFVPERQRIDFGNVKITFHRSKTSKNLQ